ncbi:hypothetical protein HYH02_009087 [Chlamydomonas schloesseri]|uniref:Uncharacterized protein n=1 Tax=Chlamydomonas schloesseri TaxID=2026947 RepID=A0A835WB95_9CHLO|nr:hypothetical protein HYH02_009087 [Chlamydomonas schloesseri]|eukprot:KAG2444148.1 hypothetical protein HYH02_009087 [Chlamydomonas schloesseri]
MAFSGPERGLAGLQRRRLQAELAETDGICSGSSKLAQARSQQAQYLLSAYRASAYRPALRASATAALTAARIPVPGSSNSQLLLQGLLLDGESEPDVVSEACEPEEQQEAVVVDAAANVQPQPAQQSAPVAQPPESQLNECRRHGELQASKVLPKLAGTAAEAKDVPTSGLRVRAPAPKPPQPAAAPPEPPPAAPSLPEESWKGLLLSLRRFHKAAEQVEVRSRSGSASGSAAAAAATPAPAGVAASKLRMALHQERNKPIEQELESAREELQEALEQLPVHRVAQALVASPASALSDAAAAGHSGLDGLGAPRASLFGNILGPSACAASRAHMLIAAHWRLAGHCMEQESALHHKSLEFNDEASVVRALEAFNRASQQRLRGRMAMAELTDALLQHSGLPALPVLELTAVADALAHLWVDAAPAMTCAPTQAAQVAGGDGDGAAGAAAGAGGLRPAAACPCAVSLELVARLVRLCADEVAAQRDKWALEEMARRRRARQADSGGGSDASLSTMPPQRRRLGQRSGAGLEPVDDDDDDAQQAFTIDGLAHMIVAMHLNTITKADTCVLSGSSSSKGSLAKRWMDEYCSALKRPWGEAETVGDLYRVCVHRVRDQLPSLLKATAAAGAGAGASAPSASGGGVQALQPWLPAALIAGAGCGLGVPAAAADGGGQGGSVRSASAGTTHRSTALRVAIARAMTDVAVNGRRLSLLVTCDMLPHLAALTAVVGTLRDRGLPHPDALLAPEAAAGGGGDGSRQRGSAVKGAHSVGRAALQGYGPLFLRFSKGTAAGSSTAAAQGPAGTAAAADTAIALQVLLVPGDAKAAREVCWTCAAVHGKVGTPSSEVAGKRNVIELPVGGLSAFDPKSSPSQADADGEEAVPAVAAAPKQHQQAQQQRGKGKGAQTPQVPAPALDSAHAKLLQQYRQQLKDCVQQFGCVRLVCPGFEALYAAALVLAQVGAELRAEHDPATGPCPVLDALPRPGSVPAALHGSTRRGSSSAIANGRRQLPTAAAGAAAGTRSGGDACLQPGWPLHHAVSAAVDAVTAHTLDCSVSMDPDADRQAAGRGRVPADWQCRRRHAVNKEVCRLLGLLNNQSHAWTAPVGNRSADGRPGAAAVPRKAQAAAAAARQLSPGELSWAEDYHLELLVLLRRDEGQQR